MDKNYYQDEEFEEFEEFDTLDDFESFEDLEQEFEEEYEEDEDGEAVWDEGDRSPVPKGHRGLKIIAGILVVLAVAVGAVIYGFRLDEVRVIGNKNYTADEIKTLIGFPEDAPNTLICYLKYFRYEAEDIPFIEDIQVKMENRNMICIEVDETGILGCLKEGKNYFYFDDNGVIQESLSEKRDTVPLITGAEVGDMEVGQDISMENRTAYKGMMELCRLLVDYEIAPKEIAIGEDGYFTIYINEGIRVGMGAPVLLEGKAAELANLLPELLNMQETEQIRGILHLENYDSTKNSIIFTKEN